MIPELFVFHGDMNYSNKSIQALNKGFLLLNCAKIWLASFLHYHTCVEYINKQEYGIDYYITFSQQVAGFHSHNKPILTLHLHYNRSRIRGLNALHVYDHINVVTRRTCHEYDHILHAKILFENQVFSWCVWFLFKFVWVIFRVILCYVSVGTGNECIICSV